MGAALVASASRVAELAAPVSRGHGAEVALSRWRRIGKATWRSSRASASSVTGGSDGPTGCLPCGLPDGGGGGGGGTRVSDIEAFPLSFSTMGFSVPASPVCPMNSGGGGAEDSGGTSIAIGDVRPPRLAVSPQGRLRHLPASSGRRRPPSRPPPSPDGRRPLRCASLVCFAPSLPGGRRRGRSTEYLRTSLPTP